MNEYHLFISHSWKYPDEYERFIDLLEGAPYFSFKDYSVPQDDPLSIYNKKYYESELRSKVRNQMRACSVIIILGGVYASYSDAIDMEIELAQELGKPILGVEPYGSERISTAVREAADKLVGWNTDSIVRAIRELSL